ncbi:hypothetical protein JW707_02610 [Candidatus Woesearchaeota archaeon]|nr:hypothetical protein [Candidatus Woesearchaeota archaeon]
MDKRILSEARAQYKRNPGKGKQIAKELAEQCGIEWRDARALLEASPFITGRTLVKILGVAGLGLASGMVGWGLYAADEKPEEACHAEIVKHEGVIDQIANLAGVRSVISRKGDYPDIIYIAQSHPHHLRDSKELGKDTTHAIESICMQLYDKYRINSIMLEGILPEDFAEYNIRGHVPKKSPFKEEQIAEFWEGYYAKILNSRRWHLYFGESRENARKRDEEEMHIKAVHDEFKAELKRAYEKAMDDTAVKKDGLYVFPEGWRDAIKEILHEDYNRLHTQANNQFKEIFTPEKRNILYNLVIAERNVLCNNGARECIRQGKGPIIIVEGTSHTEHFLSLIKDMNHIAILPEGSAENPHLNLPPEDFQQMYAIAPAGKFLMSYKGKFTEQGFKIEE